MEVVETHFEPVKWQQSVAFLGKLVMHNNLKTLSLSIFLQAHDHDSYGEDGFSRKQFHPHLCCKYRQHSNNLLLSWCRNSQGSAPPWHLQSMVLRVGMDAEHLCSDHPSPVVVRERNTARALATFPGLCCTLLPPASLCCIWAVFAGSFLASTASSCQLW